MPFDRQLFFFIIWAVFCFCLFDIKLNSSWGVFGSGGVWTNFLMKFVMVSGRFLFFSSSWFLFCSFPLFSAEFNIRVKCELAVGWLGCGFEPPVIADPRYCPHLVNSPQCSVHPSKSICQFATAFIPTLCSSAMCQKSFASIKSSLRVKTNPKEKRNTSKIQNQFADLPLKHCQVTKIVMYQLSEF